MVVDLVPIRFGFILGECILALAMGSCAGIVSRGSVFDGLVYVGCLGVW